MKQWMLQRSSSKILLTGHYFQTMIMAWLATWHPHSSFVHQYNAKTKKR